MNEEIELINKLHMENKITFEEAFQLLEDFENRNRNKKVDVPKYFKDRIDIQLALINSAKIGGCTPPEIGCKRRII